MRRIPGWLALTASCVAVGGSFALLALLEREIGGSAQAQRSRGRSRESRAEPVRTAAPSAVAAVAGKERVHIGAAHAVDDFLTELADASARFASGYFGNRTIQVGCYANGSVRLVDSNGRCYEGAAENALARMREVHGNTTFDMRLVQEGDKLRGAFQGGPYDGLTITFE